MSDDDVQVEHLKKHYERLTKENGELTFQVEKLTNELSSVRSLAKEMQAKKEKAQRGLEDRQWFIEKFVDAVIDRFEVDL